MTAALTIQQLHKSFGQVKALDGLDLTVQAGQVAGFLGPNGAGKSTTIRVVLGLLARRLRVRRRSSGCTRGTTRSRCTAGSPTCPVT